jgi:hypothetical protein
MLSPAIAQIPVFTVRDLNDQLIGIMVVCSMHPTVLHEDSTLISGDFPGIARQYLQSTFLAGNKSTLRHYLPLFPIAALLRNAGKSLDIRTNPASRSDAAINWVGK